ncbi:MAG: PP2C family protein-serine/threonine phosphatase [Brevinematales bacterium]|jgi:serine phosphatase RsbU (regulator of sigma subunit)
MRWLEKLFVLTAGREDSYPIEQRLFHVVIIMGLLVALLGNINHIIMHDHIMTIIIPTLFAVFSVFFYHLSRFGNKYNLCVWLYLFILILIVTPVLWFFNGGSRGGFDHYIFLFTIGICSLLRGKARILSLILYIFIYSALITIEYFYPGMVTGFYSEATRLFNLTYSMVLCMIMVVSVFVIYVNAYENQKNKVSKYSAELEKERNVLSDKIDTMNLELDMARSIQRQFIGIKRNLHFIDFVYHPMAKLGGDFLHLFPFRYSDEIGIFISDVSGHGVPGALITSMIYSHLLEIVPRITNPAQVLESLNNVLYGNTGNNFVTAIYGIYYPSKNEFSYANAGHNSPYVIESGKCGLLDDSGRSLPLAVMSNSELVAMDKPYIVKSEQLKKGSRLLLYTDGLTDAVNINSREDYDYRQNFESVCLIDLFKELSKMTTQEFLYQVMEKLKQFRGGEDFEDDICLVCLDFT